MAKIEGQRSHSVSLFSNFISNNITFRRRKIWILKILSRVTISWINILISNILHGWQVIICLTTTNAQYILELQEEYLTLMI
jgi:hypothetical protein